jgi:hypothetical protein
VSCWLCNHSFDPAPNARQGDKMRSEEWTRWRRSKDLQCRLNPVWVDVRGDHVCGQFRDDHWGNGYKVEEIRDRMAEPYAEMRKVRERAKNAERKLKVANAKIKKLREAARD